VRNRYGRTSGGIADVHARPLRGLPGQARAGSARGTELDAIDNGFQLLGHRIVRQPKGPKRYVYAFVSREALTSVMRKLKAPTGRSTTNLELSELIAALNLVLTGWANHG
jgi:hypothetical protein